MLPPSTQNGKWKLFLLGFGVFLLSFAVTFVLFGGVRKASQFFKNHHFWSPEKKVVPAKKKEAPKIAPVAPTTLTPEMEAIVEKFQNVLDLNASAEWKGYPLEVRKKAYEIMQERKKKEAEVSASSTAQQTVSPATLLPTSPVAVPNTTSPSVPQAKQTPSSEPLQPLDTLLQGKQ